ncbi:hypothetical protein KEM56_006623, partial [Ascosphaera pollenicola]
ESSTGSSRQASPAPISRNSSTRSISSNFRRPGVSSQQTTDLDALRRGVNIDNAPEYDHVQRPSLMERKSGLSGLPRIRHAPPDGPMKRVMTLPNLSMAIPKEFRNQEKPSTPSRPSHAPQKSLCPITDSMTSDIAALYRFPSESLHSFSFAAPPDDISTARRNTLKRSVDVMRANFGFDSSALAEPDLMESNESHLHGLFGDRHVVRKPIMQGPITGPPSVDLGNIFEKAFSESNYRGNPSQSQFMPNDADYSPVLSPIPDDDNMPCLVSSPKRASSRAPSFASRRNSSTKRSRPTLSHAASVLDLPSSFSTFGVEAPVFTGLHTHSSKWAPASQAVFTTSAQSDWTIRAANDVACLVFGVTQRELRNLSILDLIQEFKRGWLESKLRGHTARQQREQQEAESRENTAPVVSSASSTTSSANSSRFFSMGGGVTAKLLAKPPSRQARISPRAKPKPSEDTAAPHHRQKPSRGVLLCGDVIPIQRRNGATGSASVWVMEKRGGLIWVLEEVVENSVLLRIDDDGRVVEYQGTPELIWQTRDIKPDISLSRLLPRLPVDLPRERDAFVSKLAAMKYFTASTQNNLNVPVTVTELSGPHSLLISQFPHAAGMMVINATTLNIISANSVFSGTLFGYETPEGHKVTELIPNFDDYLDILFEEDEMLLSDGVLIPEQGMRRARAIMTIRYSKDDAMSLFEKPAGIPARHRDGAEIMVDVSMRVVMPGTEMPNTEDSFASARDDDPMVVKEAIYALWITYHQPVGSSSILTASRSRPISPPSQAPSPHTCVSPKDCMPMETASHQDSPTLLSQQLQEAAAEPLNNHQPREPIPEISLTELTREAARKKSINDYTILEDMGHGAYGQVKLARLKRNPAKKVVLKYVTKKRILVDTWTRDRRLGTVPLEIHVLDYLRREGLRHPNIVEMEGFFEDDINYYIEMLPHGLPGMDLFDYIELRTNMTESECRSIFSQVVGAIHHLHIKALVVHRDIKDENVILDGEGQIKLIDFGSASYVKNGPFDVFVGTIDYAAPEVLQGKSYNGKEQDIWALGILLYTIVYKENPFYNVDEILDHPLRVPYVPFSESCIDLIRGMLNRTVEKRLAIEEVMNHPWMQVDDAEQEVNVSALLAPKP